MSRERVKSKNLFNFRPQGFIDPVVLSQDVLIDPVAMEEHMKNQSEAEFAAEMRGFMDSFKATPFKTDPAYVEVEEVLLHESPLEFPGVRLVQQFWAGSSNQARWRVQRESARARTKGENL